MSSSKHPNSEGEAPFQSDLKRNPGIGQSGGTVVAGDDPDEIEGENTVEGDVENDATAGGGVNPDQLGRTDK